RIFTKNEKYDMDIKFNKNEDYNKLKVSELRQKLGKVQAGGGEKRIEKHHKKGKLTARERIDRLLDEPADAIEICAFVAEGMYEDDQGCPSARVVVKCRNVSGKHVIVVANDATVKAGAWFPMTAKKKLRGQ